MDKTLALYEFAVVLVARNHNPTILNPDFLKYNKIISENWELAENPVCTDLVAQVSFKSGIRIQAQFNRVSFTEQMRGKELFDTHIPNIAYKYVETLPHVDYRAVGINPRGYIRSESPAEAEVFVLKTFIAEGPWKEFRGIRPKAGIRMNYPSENGRLNLTIEDATIDGSEDKKLAIVRFSSNFHHDVIGDTSQEKVQSALESINAWRTDIDTYYSLIKTTFLAGEE